MSRRKLVLANNPLLSGPAYDDRARIGIPYREIALDSIDPDPNQPRVNFDQEKLDELASSIRTYGVLSPVLIRPGKTNGRFHLVAGERRLRAAKMAGLSAIPALISDANDGEGRTLAIQLVENLQRSDLTPLERAHAVAALKETNSLSVRDVAEKLGISKSMVQRSLDILELPDDLLNALRQGASESKILLLAKIQDEETRRTYLADLEGLSRSKLQDEIAGTNKGGKKILSVHLSAEDVRITEELQKSLGTKVSMTRPSLDSEGGRLVIEFYSGEDLQEIFRKLVAD